VRVRRHGMHLQVKVRPGGTGFPDDDSEDIITTSAEYRRGSFRDLLDFLAEERFNIRGASGHRIEFGGEFTFWVAKRDDDDDHEQATEKAAALLRDKGFDARVVEVSVRVLDDTPGSLRDFVREISGNDLWIEEITVGTPDSDGRIPVQIFTSKTQG
jgi:hypothetical protein